MSSAFEVFARFGLPGLVILMQFIWIWRQERRVKYMTDMCREESTSRVQDAQRYAELAIELQQKVFSAVDAIGDRMRAEEKHALDMRQLIQVLGGASAEVSAHPRRSRSTETADGEKRTR